MGRPKAPAEYSRRDAAVFVLTTLSGGNMPETHEAIVAVRKAVAEGSGPELTREEMAQLDFLLKLVPPRAGPVGFVLPQAAARAARAEQEPTPPKPGVPHVRVFPPISAPGAQRPDDTGDVPLQPISDWLALLAVISVSSLVPVSTGGRPTEPQARAALRGLLKAIDLASGRAPAAFARRDQHPAHVRCAAFLIWLFAWDRRIWRKAEAEEPPPRRRSARVDRTFAGRSGVALTLAPSPKGPMWMPAPALAALSKWISGAARLRDDEWSEAPGPPAAASPAKPS